MAIFSFISVLNHHSEDISARTSGRLRLCFRVTFRFRFMARVGVRNLVVMVKVRVKG